MRVLFFAPRECWPPTTGAMLRNYHLARALSRDARVTFLSFGDNAGAARPPEGAPEQWCERVASAPMERGYTPLKLARGALGRTPVTVLNYTSRALTAELERLLASEDFDVVQVESIHLAAYLPVIRAARNSPRVVFDWHNVESDLMRQYAARAANPLRRAYARRTAAQLAALERRTALEADMNVMCSEPDRARLLASAPGARAVVVENGVDVGFYSGGQIQRALQAWRERRGGANAEGRRRILFVGSMDYHANVDGVVRFAREAWPLVSEALPETVLTIVGRNPAPEVRALAGLKGVEVTGTVEDVRPYYGEALASVVPLEVGGGSRLKIYETMAAGVPVVSTRLGAEGVDADDLVTFAETAEEFRDALTGLARDEVKWRQLSVAGRRLASEKFDWSSLGARLAEIHKSLVEGRI